MKKRWSLVGLASIMLALVSCATHAPQQPAATETLADASDSWESWYVDAWANSGI